MKTKNQPPYVDTSNMTQFVADIPMESVITVLEGFQRFDLKAVSPPLGHSTFEVRFNNSHNTTSIYLSLQSWNQTETLLTLSYYLPKPFDTALSGAIVYVLSVTLAIILAFTFGSFLILFIVVPVFGIKALLNWAMGNGKPLTKDAADRLRTQEDLMGWIVADLQDSADLEIVEYSGKIERK